jgi:hypothetical protein
MRAVASFTIGGRQLFEPCGHGDFGSKGEGKAFFAEPGFGKRLFCATKPISRLRVFVKTKPRTAKTRDGEQSYSAAEGEIFDCQRSELNRSELNRGIGSVRRTGRDPLQEREDAGYDTAAVSWSESSNRRRAVETRGVGRGMVRGLVSGSWREKIILGRW